MRRFILVAILFVSVPLGNLLEIRGPTQFVVTTPVGVSAIAVVYGVGFGFGETVTFEQSPSLKKTSQAVELRIEAYIPATNDQVPVLLEFAPRILGILNPATAEGTTNRSVVLKTPL